MAFTGMKIISPFQTGTGYGIEKRVIIRKMIKPNHENSLIDL